MYEGRFKNQTRLGLLLHLLLISAMGEGDQSLFSLLPSFPTVDAHCIGAYTLEDANGEGD